MRVETTCMINVIPQGVRVCGVELMRQVTIRVDMLQIVDMNMGRVPGSDLTRAAMLVILEKAMTGGTGVLIIKMSVSVGPLHRVVVGDRDHGDPTSMVRMTNSNYWMGPISTTAGMLRHLWIEMGGLRSEHRPRTDVVRLHLRQRHRRRVDHQGSKKNRSHRTDDTNGVHFRC